MPHVPRNLAIGTAVVLLHGAAVWALHSGLSRRPPEVVVPIALLSQVIVPPAPEPVAAPAPAPAPAPALAPAPAPLPPKKVARSQPPRPRPAPAPRPVAAPSPAPAPEAAAAVSARRAPAAPVAAPAAEAQPPALPMAAPVAEAPTPAPAPTTGAAAPVAPPAPPRIALPSSDAAYLRNPQPPYPPLSRRFGEEGRVMLRVLVGPDGAPRRVELARSSDFDRLDRAAEEAVRGWRFVPGTRDGVAEEMWVNVPINFNLRNP